MGHRLSKIVTRTGDAGTTGLGDGARVAKDAARIDAIGAVDELNSSIGVLLAETLPDAVSACLVDVQHDLFDLGGELSIPGYEAVSAAHVARLEERVEHFNGPLAPLKEFVLPGGTRAVAQPRRAGVAGARDDLRKPMAHGGCVPFARRQYRNPRLRASDAAAPHPPFPRRPARIRIDATPGRTPPCPTPTPATSTAMRRTTRR